MNRFFQWCQDIWYGGSSQSTGQDLPKAPVSTVPVVTLPKKKLPDSYDFRSAFTRVLKDQAPLIQEIGWHTFDDVLKEAGKVYGLTRDEALGVWGKCYHRDFEEKRTRHDGEIIRLRSRAWPEELEEVDLRNILAVYWYTLCGEPATTKKVARLLKRSPSFIQESFGRAPFIRRNASRRAYVVTLSPDQEFWYWHSRSFARGGRITTLAQELTHFLAGMEAIPQEALERAIESIARPHPHVALLQDFLVGLRLPPE